MTSTLTTEAEIPRNSAMSIREESAKLRLVRHVPSEHDRAELPHEPSSPCNPVIED